MCRAEGCFSNASVSLCLIIAHLTISNINHGTALERMRVCIEVAQLLITHPLGKRIVGFMPFCSNGDGLGWPVGYLMRDPAAYAALGAWMG